MRFALRADQRSPRVILVAHQGQLKGLVTVKDVLRHEARHEANLHRSSSMTNTVSPVPPGSPRIRPPGLAEHGRRDSTGSTGSASSWTNWQETWAPIEEDDGRRHGQGLEIALEEAYGWLTIRGSRVYASINKGLEKVGLIKASHIDTLGEGRHGGEGNAAFEYELNDDIRPAG